MRTLINNNWLFSKLPCGSTAEDAEKAVFEPVDLPHDWLIWQENDLYESADAWYKRTVELPENHDPVVLIRFDGVYMDCDVLLNGEVLCTHPYGYTAFDVPLTGKIKPGQNQLMVHIRHQSPNSRWYSGSGIYRDVHLVTLPEQHLVPDSLYVTEESYETNRLLKISAETAGTVPQPFLCNLLDREGRTVASANGICRNRTVQAELMIQNCRNWSPDDPYLYTLLLHYGKQTEVRKIGLRTVSLDPEKGLLINGIQTKLRGVCLHHDLGALGAAFHEKAARRQLALMKEMGVNAVRTSHNPPASKFLDLCDEMGILVDDEAFDMWERSKTTYDYARFFREWHNADVASWIRRDRCHPSVILWSIGNEIYDMHADAHGAEITRTLAELVRQHDPACHAYVTFGCNYMPWEGGQRCAEFVDAVGYNYGEKLYHLHHEKHPDWIIYGSETASVLSSRGIYHFPIEQSIMSESDFQCSALGNSNTSWGADNLNRMIIEDQKNPYSLGQFIWSGIDYIGEPTPYHTRSCYFGQADTACFPKDAFYLFQRSWSDQKMIHLGVNWDWNAGQMIDVPVISNCDSVELLLNGQSVGRFTPDYHDPDKSLPVWKLPFVKGCLTARGFDEAGNLVCEDIRRTPEDTDHLVLRCENDFLSSDGWDLAFVTVTAEDRNGCPVENDRTRVKISVSGGGRLIGTDNGDSTDPDGYKTDCRRLFSGKLLLIIGSNGIKENVRVLVHSENIPDAEISIPVRSAEPIPGVSFLQQVYHRIPDGRKHARRLDLRADGSTCLTPDHPVCSFHFSVLPAGIPDDHIQWQITNAAGILAPYAYCTADKEHVSVHASGDGDYYLRGMLEENGQCVMISQMEFSASGFGNPALDPYTYISAGLYDLHEGDIGTGNEKGIAFSRDGESMIGFSSVQFGKTGSDLITVDLFALNGDAYDLQLWTGEPGEPLRLAEILRYQKPSIWNVYQSETWRLPQRLTGIRTICFRMKEKVHMKGFVFEKLQNAFLTHKAGEADSIYGDCFERNGDSVFGIGNNVTLTWSEMDFGDTEDVVLEITGHTPLPVCTVSIRIRNGQGEETSAAADFLGTGPQTQKFQMRTPSGLCSVSFVFLPGSAFNFQAYCFTKPKNWTDQKE